MTRPGYEQIDDTLVARLPHEVDLATADTIASELMAAVPGDGTGLVVDLGATRYIDSAGISMLFRIRDRLRERRQRMAVVRPPSSPLRRVLEIVALDSAIPVRDDLEQALDEVRSAGAGEPV